MSSHCGSAHDDPTEGAPRYCLLYCPFCHAQHVDEGEWAERLHHKHLCLNCNRIWRVEPYCFGVTAVENHGPDQEGG